MRAKKATNIINKVAAITMSAILLLGQGAMPTFSVDAFAAEAGVEQYIKKLSDQEIMFGDQNGNMNPDRSITRAEFVAMVNRAFGLREADAATFSDIKGDEWYANDIKIAKTAGYFSGAENNKALPNNTLTREQATALVFRNLYYDKIAPENYTFSDSLTFSQWGRPAINTASQKGFITGYNDGSFRPQQAITRGEVAKMLSVAVGDHISEGGEKSLGSTAGNVTVVNSGVTLRDTIINGDLYITKGVGLGFTTFENVTVTGETIITGAGASNAGDSSILFKDCNMGNIVIEGPEKKTVAVRMDGNTNIQDVKVKSNTIIEEYSNHSAGFHNVVMAGPPDTTLHLLGDFDKVSVMMPKNNLYLDSGAIAELVVDEEAPDSVVNLYEDTYTDKLYLDIKTEVTGTGDVGYLKVNAPDSKISMLPDVIDITPGLEANINGKDMTSKDGLQSSAQPKILSKYPVMDEILATNIKAIYKTNKIGKLYYAVTLEDDDKLSVEEIMKPSTKKTIITSGKTDIKAETELNQAVSGLKVNTKYRISAVLEDGRGDLSSISNESFTTLDNIVPAYANGYPKINSTTNTSAELSVVATKDVTIHWAVLLKGHQAPTEIELKKDKADGAVTKGSTKVKKNEIATFTASGLIELKDYDVYMLLSDGENDSAISKLAFTTKDMTAPEIEAGYPRLDKVTDTSVIVKAKSNEDGTIYYVVMKRGAAFPPPIEGVLTPSLDSEEAKRAVVTANNTFKNGRSAARAGIEADINISGLSPETTYDLYMVAEDKAKNLSAIKSLIIKTSDTIAPKVTQEFEDMVGEKPDDKPEAMTDIRIVFSEEVWNSLTIKGLDNETMQDCIILYDMTDNRKPLVELNYFNAKIETMEGKTVVTFPASSRPDKLRSGNKYQFEINNIVDTSGNKMQQKTKLPEFQIVAPLVDLISTTPPEDPALDMTFQIQPTSKDTADEMLFDTLIYSDQSVEFLLYEKDDDSQQFKVITEPRTGAERVNKIISSNGCKSLSAMLDDTIYEVGVSKKIPYKPFNELKTKEYGIYITKIGTSRRGEWSGMVKMKVKSLIGGRSILDSASMNFETALTAGGIAVHVPTNFEMTRVLQDNLVPRFHDNYPYVGTERTHDGSEEAPDANEGYKFYEYVGDVLVQPRVRANKKCTLYYLVAPKGTVGTPDDPVDVDDLINLAGSAPDKGAKGQFQIGEADYEYYFDITKLSPKTNYDMYMVLVSGESSSAVETIHFRTRDVYAPKMSNAKITANGNDFVDITFDIDRTAIIDWIVYQSESSNGPSDQAVTVNHIHQQVQDPPTYTLVDGKTKLNGPVVPPNIATQAVTIRVKNLTFGIGYSFYAVAKSGLGGQDSEILKELNFTSRDLKAPAITVGNTFIDNQEERYKGEPYKGGFTLKFDESAYHVIKDPVTNADVVNAVTLTTFINSLTINAGDGGSVNVDGKPTQAGRIAVTGYASEGRSFDSRSQQVDNTPILQVKFAFQGIKQGANISSSLRFCDINGNIAGYLSLVFKNNETEDGKNRAASTWIVTMSE